MRTVPDDIHRIAAKLFLADPGAFDAAAPIGVFHTWIREGGVADGLLIDVADYRHVPDGPGVMLIGHEWDRALDFGGGRPGVMSVAKRGLQGPLVERIRAVVADALRTASSLAEPRWLGPGASVATDRLELTLLDRLRAPNTPETLEAVRPVVSDALASLGDLGEPVPHGDPRRPFSVIVPLSADGDPAELAARLDAVAAAV